MQELDQQGATNIEARPFMHNDDLGPQSRRDCLINGVVYALSAVAVGGSLALLFLVAM